MKRRSFIGIAAAAAAGTALMPDSFLDPVPMTASEIDWRRMTMPEFMRRFGLPTSELQPWQRMMLDRLRNPPFIVHPDGTVEPLSPWDVFDIPRALFEPEDSA